jgi:hypothetical protein
MASMRSIRSAWRRRVGTGSAKVPCLHGLFFGLPATRPRSKGVVTANTTQLETKTWAELAKWKKRCATGNWFKLTTGKMSMRLSHVDDPEGWRCDAITCREENSEAFAGLHAADSSAYYLFDEGSAIPDMIYDVAEGGVTDGESFHFVFGNPTRNTGRFRAFFGKFRHRCITRQIDSRDAKLPNKAKVAGWSRIMARTATSFASGVSFVVPAACNSSALTWWPRPSAALARIKSARSCSALTWPDLAMMRA